MRSRPFGPLSRPVPVVGQGTWNMETAPAASVAALRRGLDLGLAHIDTAEMYGAGEVERIVGDAIEGRRDEVFLVSKVLPGNATRDGTARACERSLRRLRTDRLDLCLLHWPSEHPLEETIDAFEQLRADGKILSWGLSNFDVDGLAAALRIAGPDKVACNQVLYHLGERYVEAGLLDFCTRHRIALVGYSPFGSGEFPSPSSAGGRVLARVAAAHKATPRQVALAFLLRHENVFVIPRSASTAHVEENAAAAALRLTPGDIRHLEQAFPLKAAGELPTL